MKREICTDMHVYEKPKLVHGSRFQVHLSSVSILVSVAVSACVVAIDGNCAAVLTQV
jgi:hypothetical protein